MPAAKQTVPNTIRLLLVDNHPVVLDGLRSTLRAHGDLEIVGEARDGTQAVELGAALRPNVVLIDTHAPGTSGPAATRALKALVADVAVIAFCANEATSHLAEMLEAGATGYVLKRANPSELIIAVHTVAAGGTYIDSRMTQALLDEHRDTARAEDAPQLSEREGKVLQAVARGYSNKEIAAQLALSVKTVETYKARSMEKLQLRSRVDIVHYAALHKWLK